MKELLKINNHNGEALCVEKYSANNPKASVVFCHGITGCRKGRNMDDDYFQNLAAKLEDLGYNVILFDYSGHGESEGNDYDVCLSKSVSELTAVFDREVDTSLPVHFLAFSYGAAVLNNFLNSKKEVTPSKIVLYSPCIFPTNSCFLTEKSIFGKDVYKEFGTGAMEKNGYATVGAKGFRLGFKMITECKTFIPDALVQYSSNILVLSGKNDVILDTSYNTQFFEERGIQNIWLDASHSLFEDIERAFELTTNFFEGE